MNKTNSMRKRKSVKYIKSSIPSTFDSESYVRIRVLQYNIKKYFKLHFLFKFKITFWNKYIDRTILSEHVLNNFWHLKKYHLLSTLFGIKHIGYDTEILLVYYNFSFLFYHIAYTCLI